VSFRPIFPELVAARSDGYQERGWRVEEGQALRGLASCDFTHRVVQVPLGRSGVERIVRAHELMHIRVSPHDVDTHLMFRDIPAQALDCAEELRVNELLARSGLPVGDLADGSERAAGERLARNGEWERTVYFLAAVMGTGAERAFLRGVRAGAPGWTKGLGVLRRRVRALLAGCDTAELASTRRVSEEPASAPHGFVAVTVPVAQLLARVAESAVPRTDEDLARLRRSLGPAARRLPTGQFAQLVFDDGLQYSSAPATRTTRRLRPDVAGVALRFPSRLLTDSNQRAFARPRPDRGGIVVIDQSGSMDVDPGDVEQMTRVCPCATVLGYSHRPGDRSERPNAWLLAHAGRRATTARHGNVGNGVDGPALAWAAARRRRGDRIIWVTDGQVTDSNDHPDRALSAECARLVRRHRIAMVRTIDEARRVLGGCAPSEPATRFGRVGRELAN
jgi:hypothetical protein